MTEALSDFMEAQAARPFRWGREGPDCILNLGDWVKARRGFDPCAPWRGRYSTRLGAARLIGKAGGLVGLLDQVFARLKRIDQADRRAGDIGVVIGLTVEGERPCGAIYTGRRWVSLSADGGLVAGPARCLAAWRV